MQEPKRYYAYILGSISGTLYVGMTHDLVQRVWQHRQHEIAGFTKDYKVDRLLHYEAYDRANRAIHRE